MTDNEIWCGLLPKPDNSYENICEKSYQEICQDIHDDPEPGASWGACQVTAAHASVLDRAIKLGATPDRSMLARRLLQVRGDGSSPSNKELKERLQSIGLVCAKSKSEPSGKSCKNIFRELQNYLRESIGQQVGVTLKRDERSHELSLENRMEGFLRSLEVFKENKNKIVLAIYEGVPNIFEVRSLIGAEYLVPYYFNEEQDAWEFNRSHSYNTVAGEGRWKVTETGGFSQEGGSSHINRVDATEDGKVPQVGQLNEDGHRIHVVVPRVSIPKENESLVIFHMGFPVQNSCALGLTPDQKELIPGNIVSRLALDQFDPENFAKECFSFMQNGFDGQGFKNFKTFNPRAFPLSLFHFSFVHRYCHKKFEDLGVEPANGIVFSGIKYNRPSILKPQMPLLIYENVTDPEDYFAGKGANFFKAEKDFRYTLRIVLIESGEIDFDKSYIEIENHEDGVFHLVDDEKLLLKQTRQLFSIFNTYHRTNFCLLTREKLHSWGLTSDFLSQASEDELKALVKKRGNKKGFSFESLNDVTPVILKDQADPHFLIKSTQIHYYHDHIWYLFALVKDDENNIDWKKSYLRIENAERGQRKPIEGERKALDLAKRFFNICLVQLEHEFSKPMKDTLLDLSLDEQAIENLMESNLKDLLIDVGSDREEKQKLVREFVRPIFAHEFYEEEVDFKLLTRVIVQRRITLKLWFNEKGYVDFDRTFMSVNFVVDGKFFPCEQSEALHYGEKFVEELNNIFRERLCERTRNRLRNIGLDYRQIQELINNVASYTTGEIKDP